MAVAGLDARQGFVAVVEGVVEAGRDDGAGLSGRKQRQGERKRVAEHGRMV